MPSAHEDLDAVYTAVAEGKMSREQYHSRMREILHDEFGDRGIASFQPADQPPREDKTNPIVLTGICKK